MGKNYVVDGAQLYCKYGNKLATFKVPIDHNAFIQRKAQGNVKDARPGFNITSSGHAQNAKVNRVI